MATAEFGTETEWQFEATDLAPIRAQLHATPELGGFRLVAAGTRELEDCYMDTADARFAQAGYALRVRTDGARAEATLKAIGGESTVPRVRSELRQALKTGNPGALLSAHGPVAERVRAVAGNAPLERLFRVRTHRDVWHAVHGDLDAAEIVLDESRIAAGDFGEAVALQRVEVELHEASAAAVKPLLQQLTGGSELAPAARSKFETGVAAAGLTSPASAPAKVEATITPEMTVMQAGQLLLHWQLQVWRQLEAAVRMDVDDDALHQLRVCGRRIIGALRLLEYLPSAQARRLRLRFQKFLHCTGAARDVDVQSQFLAMLAAESGHAELAPLRLSLRRQRHAERKLLVRRLAAARTVQLLQSLVLLANAPAPRRAPRQIGAVSGTLLLRRCRKLRRQARLAFSSGNIDAVHALRLQAKKLRYLAEPLVAVHGAPLRRYLRRLRALQSLLGDLHDVVQIAQGLQRQLAQNGESLPSAAVFAMGRLVEQGQRKVRDMLPAIADAWQRLRGKSWRRLRRELRTTLVEPQRSTAV